MSTIGDLIFNKKGYGIPDNSTKYLNSSRLIDCHIIHMVEILKDFYTNYDIFMHADIDDLRGIIIMPEVESSARTLFDIIINKCGMADIKDVNYKFIDDGRLERTDRIISMIRDIGNYTDEIKSVLRTFQKMLTDSYVLTSINIMIEDIMLLQNIFRRMSEYDEFDNLINEIDD